MILLHFPKMTCAVCHGIGAMRLEACRVVGASRCAARAVRVERRNKLRPALAAPMKDGFGEPILRADLVGISSYRSQIFCVCSDVD